MRKITEFLKSNKRKRSEIFCFLLAIGVEIAESYFPGRSLFGSETIREVCLEVMREFVAATRFDQLDLNWINRAIFI